MRIRTSSSTWSASRDRLHSASREDAWWIKGWIVDRLAAGGIIAPLERHRPLESQFPVWASVTQNLCGAAGEKCSFCLWPHIGSIHSFSNDWRNDRVASSAVLVHHFKWHSDLISRTRRWIADYMSTGKPWEGWTATRHRLLDHYHKHDGRIAVEQFLWRNRVHGWFDFATWYEQLAREVPEGGKMVEAGVWQGASLIHLAQACRALGRKVSLYGIDLFARAGYLGAAVPPSLSRITRDGSWLHLAAQNLLEHGVLDEVNLLQLPIDRGARCFDDASVFACHIDGAHDYHSVTSDITAWWPKIAPGGYLSGHDWNQTEVHQAVTRLATAEGLSVMTHGPTVWILQKSSSLPESKYRSPIRKSKTSRSARPAAG